LKYIFNIAIFISVLACESTSQNDNIITDSNIIENVDTQLIAISNNEDEKVDLNETSQMQTAYIVCLDSGKTYFTLDKLMYKNANDYHVTIDTANRSYNKQKDLIALSEDDDDQMYAGEYFPRRYNSSYLSLEYLYVYDDNIDDKTIGLIAGIYDDKKDADSVLTIFKPSNPKAFVLKGDIYMGCMH